eukprot:XP_001709339.1 Hypothetical protein GL50803_35903 [Giardia lamblia ATCC 50803]
MQLLKRRSNVPSNVPNDRLGQQRQIRNLLTALAKLL